MVRNDLEEEDNEESYYRYMEENPNVGLAPVDEEGIQIEYDEDGNPIPPEKKKLIDPLPPIDHSTISYLPFRKDFYNVHSEIEDLPQERVKELRQTLGLTVTGNFPPNPVSSFGHFGFDDKLLKAIIKAEYSSPTPIQAQVSFKKIKLCQMWTELNIDCCINIYTSVGGYMFLWSYLLFAIFFAKTNRNCLQT